MFRAYALFVCVARRVSSAALAWLTAAFILGGSAYALNDPPNINKSFGAESIPVGASTSLSFIITLAPPTSPPATAGWGSPTTCPPALWWPRPTVSVARALCFNGTITATAGSGSISLSGATLPPGPGPTCSFAVNVTGTSTGTKINSVQVTSDQGTGNTSTSTITVTAPSPPSISKSFGAASINVGASTSLSFSISNPNGSSSLSGVGFNDTLPAGLVVATPNGSSGSCGGGTITATPGSGSISLPGLVVATPNGSSGSCGGGTITATPGSGSISLSGATLAGSASCTFAVNVTATSTGTKVNTTSAVTSNEGGNGNTATASIMVTSTPPPPQSRVTIVKVAVGRDGSFAFSSTLPGASSFTVTTSGGSASQQFQNLPAGTFTVSEATPPVGFKVTSVQCDGVPQNPPTATITLTGSNSVTCTFTDTFDTQGIQTATQAAIRNFLSHRANAITSSEPDGTRGNGRLTGWLFGGGGNGGQPPSGPAPLMGPSDASAVARGLATGVREPDADPAATRPALFSPFRLSGSAEDGTGAILFSTSLTQMRQAAAEAAKTKDIDPAMGLGGPAPRGGGGLGTTRPALYDIWFEARTNFYDDNRAATKQSGHTNIVFVGADYRLHPAILVGVLAQFDWAGESPQARSAPAPTVRAGCWAPIWRCA